MLLYIGFDNIIIKNKAHYICNLFNKLKCVCMIEGLRSLLYS